MNTVNLNKHNRIKIKRRISAVMAGVLILTGAGVTSLLTSREVLAKETLESIKKVVKTIDSEHPYKILEIVPDSVSYNMILTDSYGNEVNVSGNQSMGRMGYYVGGKEPIRQDMSSMISDRYSDNKYVYATISDSNLRYNLFDKLIEPLIDENTGVAHGLITEVPFFINDGYYEIREGEALSSNDLALSDEDFNAVIKNMTLMEHDYYGKKGDAYVDTARGIVKLMEDASGEYVRIYNKPEQKNDIASEFLRNYLLASYDREHSFPIFDDDSGLVGLYDDNFRLLSYNSAYSTTAWEINAGEERNNASFDPNLKFTEEFSDSESLEAAYVNFTYNEDADYGYYVRSVIDKIDPSVTGSALREVSDTYGAEVPLYTFDEEKEVYVYAGDLEDVFRDKLYASRDNSSNDFIAVSDFHLIPKVLATPDESISLLTVDNSIIDDNKNDTIGEDEQEIVPGSASSNEIPTNEENSISENKVDSAPKENPDDEEYYILEFALDDEERNVEHYRVNFFKHIGPQRGAQYVIDYDSEYGVLIPNIYNNGLISVSETCPEDYFIYDYSKGLGNYSFRSVPPSYNGNEPYGVYKIRGSKIYYSISIINNEWFKQYVFDRDEDQYKNLVIDVVSIPVSKLTLGDLNDVRFIALLCGDTTHCIGDSFKNYEYGKNDFDLSVYRNIVNMVANNKIPFIGDYKIVSDYENLRRTSTATLKEPVVAMFVEMINLSTDERETYSNALANTPDYQFESEGLTLTDYGLINNVNNGHFVKGNAYSYNWKRPNQANGTYVSILNKHFFTAFPNGERDTGFKEVYDDITTENNLRAAEKLGKIANNDVSEATSIRYIVGYSQKRIYIASKVGDIHVLELEPCASWDLRTDSAAVLDNGDIEGTKLFHKDDEDHPIIAKDENDKDDKTRVRVTRMTTSEFIGRIEDINVDYDLIYIGLNTDLFNKRDVVEGDKGKSVTDREFTKYKADGIQIVDYNDLNMDGLVYTNVGDYVYYRIRSAGMLENEYTDDKHLKSQTTIRDAHGGTDVYKTRYSGNDLSEEKLDKLKEFVDAGFPVLFDNDVYDTETEGTSTLKKVNSRRIDSASYMYMFMDYAKSQDNVFVRNEIANSNSMFKFYVNLAKPRIILGEGSDTELSTRSVINVRKNTNDGYFYLPFSFKIENKGSVSTTSKYKVNLYIDVNADGKYSLEQESVNFSILRNSDTSEIISKSDKAYIVDPDVNYYGTYRLSGEETGVVPWRLVVRQDDGKELRRANATGYFKVDNDKEVINVLQINSVDQEVVDNGNSRIREPSSVKYGDDTTTDNGWPINSKYQANWNMQENYDKGKNGESNRFYELLTDPVVPYDIRITTIDSTQFSAVSAKYRDLCKSSNLVDDNGNPVNTDEKVNSLNTKNRTIMTSVLEALDDDEKDEMKKEYREYISDNKYNMLILGFGDNYVAPNLVAMEAIKDYAQEGYSILFTHDTTSMSNTLVDENGFSKNAENNTSSNVRVLDRYQAFSGYECNKIIRNLVGMDRYDVLKEADAERKFKVDKIYEPKTSRDSDHEIRYQNHGFTYGHINTLGYFGRYWDGSYNKKTIWEEYDAPNWWGVGTHKDWRQVEVDDEDNPKVDENVRVYVNLYDQKYPGYTDKHNFQTSEAYANLKNIDRTNDNYSWNDYGRSSENPNGNPVYAVGQYYDMEVKKVNSGQITEYPYKLPEKFPVARTHMQWFQLDFTADDDYDGETDIVVWYTINGSGLIHDEIDSNHRDKDTDHLDMYALSPGDVRNNYYIYNKGNITYSGVGHSGVMEGGSEDEMKLFINTMVAAYRTGLHAPDITFKDGYDGLRNTTNIYITYDEQIKDIKDGVVGSTKELYFLPEQTSIVQNSATLQHTLSAKFYYEVESTNPDAVEIICNGETCYGKPLDILTDGVTYKDPGTGVIAPGDLGNLKSGCVYKVEFNTDAMLDGANRFFLTNSEGKKKNTRRIFVVGTDRIVRHVGERPISDTEMTAATSAKMIRTELFNLD